MNDGALSVNDGALSVNDGALSVDDGAAAGTLRLATRGSPLARWQAGHVGDGVRRRHPGVTVELVVVATEGDRRSTEPIGSIGGKGVFVREVQAAVLDGRADAAVHSAKDMPAGATLGLVLAAVAPRADPRDVLVGGRLSDLAPGATVATGAPRRRSQLAHLRPDLTFRELRGNIGTRLEAAHRQPIVMAAAALARLGTDPSELGLVVDVLDTADLLPQVGQGAIAVECGDEDGSVAGLLSGIDHARSHREVSAERAFLAELGGDCDLPCGAHATSGPGGVLHIEAMLASLDGRVLLREAIDGEAPEGGDAEALGTRAALALLDGAGGRDLLEAGR